MNCQLSMEIRLAVTQSLQINGDATESIFPQVEALLFANLEYQKGLEFVAKRKKMGKYTSIVDFLFCELHPKWKIKCFRYYAGNGPILKELIDVTELIDFNERMLVALNLAQKMYHDKECKGWSQFQGKVKKIYDCAA